MMKMLYTSLLLIFYIGPTAPPADPIDKVANLIRRGNIHELSGIFAPNIEITILNEENVYSRTQAEIILDKFFSENKPLTVKMLHNINSNPNYRFGVMIIKTDRGTYRLACTLKQTDANLQLIEIRIETEKIK